PIVESQEAVRERLSAELDKGLRAAYKYLSEVVSQVNSLTPVVETPYPVLFLGKIPQVQLSSGFVDMRPKRVAGVDICEFVQVTYKAAPHGAAGESLFGDEIAKCVEHIKSLRLEPRVDIEQKNDFGQARRARVGVAGTINCLVNMKAD